MLLNLTRNQEPDIEKTYLYFKNPFESKYRLFINGRKKAEIEKLKNPKAFLDYSQTTNMFIKILKTIMKQRKGNC